jgi:hypothetical protein
MPSERIFYVRWVRLRIPGPFDPWQFILSHPRKKKLHSTARDSHSFLFFILQRQPVTRCPLVGFQNTVRCNLSPDDANNCVQVRGLPAQRLMYCLLANMQPKKLALRQSFVSLFLYFRTFKNLRAQAPPLMA